MPNDDANQPKPTRRKRGEAAANEMALGRIANIVMGTDRWNVGSLRAALDEVGDILVERSFL